MADLLVAQGADEPGHRPADARCGACGAVARRPAAGMPPTGWVYIGVDAVARLGCSLACAMAVLDGLAACTPMALAPPPLPTRRRRSGSA